MKNILIIHQSAELYGSDKTLLYLLQHLDRTKFNPIVILPSDGLLKSALEKHSITVVIAPVIKLYRNLFKPKNLFLFFKDSIKSYKTLKKLHQKHHFEIVYSNTLAVLAGVLFSKINKIKHLWHVHEIIEKPNVFRKLFTIILGFKSITTIVYNSQATANFWNTTNVLKSKNVTIYNGLQTPTKILTSKEIENIKKNLLKVNPDDILIALVGRISRWKGHFFLLDAFAKINYKYPNVRLVFVGETPPNQEFFLHNLERKISELNLENDVQIIPFQQEIQTVWQSIDIAVVPSIEPEPFGMVAIEAMFAHKPVIGSNHGGLKEIIKDNETGFLEEPNNPDALAQALQKLIDNPETRIAFGEKGYQRATQLFSIENYVSSFENLLLKM